MIVRRSDLNRLKQEQDKLAVEYPQFELGQGLFHAALSDELKQLFKRYPFQAVAAGSEVLEGWIKSVGDTIQEDLSE